MPSGGMIWADLMRPEAETADVEKLLMLRR